MPLEVVSTDGQTFRYWEYALSDLGPRDVRVRVEFAAPKHGTELHSLTGNPHHRKQWDEALRLYLPRVEPLPLTERPVGNMVVGAVTEVGTAATGFAPGDRVFGYGPIREEHQLPDDSWRPLDGLSATDAVCSDPAHVALVAVRDGNVRIGDAVAVFGMGAIGLMTVQIAACSGATTVIAVDPVESRRANRPGAWGRRSRGSSCRGRRTANQARDRPTTAWTWLLKPRATPPPCTKPYAPFASAEPSCTCPMAPRTPRSLQLDEEFHVNRPTIIGSQAVWRNPDRSYPLWDEERARVTAIELFRRGLVTSEGIVTPIVGFTRRGPGSYRWPGCPGSRNQNRGSLPLAETG